MSKKTKTTALPKKGTAARRYKSRAQRETEINRAVLIGTAVIAGIVILILALALFMDGVLRPNQVVASINGQSIVARDFERQAKFERWRSGLSLANFVNRFDQQFRDAILGDVNFGGPYAREYQSLQFPRLKAQNVLNDMIDTLVIRDYAKKNNITVSQAEIDKQVFDYFAYQPTPPTGTPTGTFTPTRLAPATATPLPPTTTPFPAGTPTSTPVPPTSTPLPTGVPTATPGPTEAAKQFQDDAKAYYERAAQISGFGEAEVRQVLTDLALRNKVRDAVVGEPPKTAEQKKVRIITVRTLQEATDVMAALQRGESWAALAASVSLDVSTKNLGGEIGWLSRDDIRSADFGPEFEATIWGPQANAGAILGPIDLTRFTSQNRELGFTIIQIIAIDPARAISSDEGEQLQLNKFTAWLNEQRQLVNAQTFSPWTDFVPTAPSLTEMGLPESVSSSSGLGF